MARRIAVTVAVLWLSGCSGTDGDGGGPFDGAPADDAAGEPNIPWLAEGEPPVAPPTLVPCPDGWAEVTSEAGDLTCEPYPAGGPADCAPDEAHFPGADGCVRLGSACPADGLPEDLPADAAIVYVLAGATGGDGSRALPYGALDAFAWGSLRTGAVVAVGRGTYEGLVRLPAGVTLWGACVAETVLGSTEYDVLVGVIDVARGPSGVRQLTIADSERRGIRVAGDGVLDLRDVVVRSARLSGVSVQSRGELMAEGLVVRGTRTDPAGISGQGITVVLGTAEVSRAVLEGNRVSALVSSLPGARVTLTDSVLRDTRSQESDGSGGRGLGMQDGASLEASRVLIEANRGVGLFLSGEGVTATLASIMVRDTQSRESGGSGGRGVSVQLGATVQADRMLVDRNRELGVYVADPGSTLRLSDAIVRDTQARVLDGLDGRGIEVQEGGSLEAERLLVADSRELGVHVGQGAASAVMSDVTIRDTRGRESDDTAGRALNVQRGAILELSRGIVDRNHDIGVFVGADGASATLSDVLVRDTRPQPCATGACAASPFGTAVGAFLGGSITMSRFVIDQASLCGVHVATDGAIDLADGEVQGCTIGACLQVDGYDVTRLTSGVRYTDNEVNLQATDLPVPELSVPTAAP